MALLGGEIGEDEGGGCLPREYQPREVVSCPVPERPKVYGRCAYTSQLLWPYVPQCSIRQDLGGLHLLISWVSVEGSFVDETIFLARHIMKVDWTVRKNF